MKPPLSPATAPSRHIPNIHRLALPAILIAAVFTLLTGCMRVGPDYVKPTPETPSAWRTTSDPAVTPGKDIVRYWWTVFDDPLLTRLIGEADSGNLELKTAVARIKQARAQIGVVAGELYPQVNATGSATHQRPSENTATSYGISAYNDMSVGLGASWELDLFGRVSRSVEAATADLEAAQEDRTDVMVSLYSDVARNYLTLRAAQARMTATLGNIESQKQILDLTKLRFQYGLASELDVSQAENVLATSESQVPPLREEISKSTNAISILLGKPPGRLCDELLETKPIPAAPASVTVGVPADVLRQRPDIRRAERKLAAQTARIGIATADLYPRFSLIGSFGFEAENGGDLFQWGSRMFSLGPSMTWNIFNAGSVRSQIKVQDALTEQALLSYEQTVLNAVGEVEDSLSSYIEGRNRVAALQRSVAASNRTLELAIRLYKEGLTNFQDVLDAERTVFDSENQLAVAQGTIAISFVQVYKALGGGWDPNQPQPPVEPEGMGAPAAPGDGRPS